MVEIALIAFANLFVIVDPIGLVPLFVGLTRHMDRRARVRAALMGPLVGFLVLLTFALVGDSILTYLGIGMPAFRAAGGLLLLLFAIEMIFEKRTRRREKQVEDAAQATPEPAANDDVSVFPLGVPLIAGPGAMTAIMLLMHQQTGNLAGQATVLGVLLGVCLISLLAFLGAARISHWISPALTMVVTRVLGVLLAALATQHLFDGISAVFR